MKAMPPGRQPLVLGSVLLALLMGLAAQPVAASPVFTPSLAFSEEYTDNVYSEATGEREDFISVVSPKIQIEAAEPRYKARLAYSPGFTFHHRNASDDSVRHNADGLFAAQLGRQTELTVTDRFMRTDEPRTSGEEEAVYAEWIDPTLRQGRKTWYANTAGVTLKHRFGRKDSFDVGYRHRLMENDDPLLDDSQRHTPWTRLVYWFDASFGLDTDLSYERGLFESPAAASEDLRQYQGTVKAMYRIGEHFMWFARYTHTETDYDGSTPDYSTYDPGIGLSWNIGKATVLDLDAGYFWQARDGAQKESGVSFKGALETKLENRLDLRLSAESGYEEASYGAESLGLDVYYQGRVGLAYEMTRELSLRLDGAYRYNKYADTQPLRKDDVYDAALAVHYRPAAFRWMRLALTGRRHEVCSTVDEDDVVENSVMLSISVFPLTPYRF